MAVWLGEVLQALMRAHIPLNLFLGAKKPSGASILCFHGAPSPHEAIAGYRGKHLNTWVKPCAWVKALWEAV